MLVFAINSLKESITSMGSVFGKQPRPAGPTAAEVLRFRIALWVKRMQARCMEEVRKILAYVPLSLQYLGPR